jgi:SAM-dependent methyltransferase
VVDEVRKLQPKSVLDIGVGFGKWGFLFREYLDVMAGRPFKKDWAIQIDGIEIFDPYIEEHQPCIYDAVIMGDCVKIINTIDSYDLVFMSDVLEHIQKDIARQFILDALRKCKHFLLVIPMTSVWLNSQGMVYGNAFEAHISAWEHADFEKHYKILTHKSYDCKGRPIDMYLLKGSL